MTQVGPLVYILVVHRGNRTWAQVNAWQAASIQDVRIIRTLSDRVTKPVYPPEDQRCEMTRGECRTDSYRYYYKYTIYTMASTTNQRWMSRYNLNFIRCSPTPRGCSSNIRFLMVSYSMTNVETEETDKMLARRQCSPRSSMTVWRGQHLSRRCLPRVKHSNVYKRRKKR